MNLYFVVPFLVWVAILQSALASRLSVGGARPELMALVVMAWTLRRGAGEGVVWAFCGGLALDLLSAAPLGSSSFALMVVAALTDLTRRTAVRSQALLPWVLAAVATLIYYGVVLIILALAGRPAGAGVIFLYHGVPSAVYNVILVALVYSFLSWLDRRTGEPELRW